MTDKEKRRTLRKDNHITEERHLSCGILQAIKELTREQQKPKYVIQTGSDLTPDGLLEYMSLIFKEPPMQYYIFHPDRGLVLYKRGTDGKAHEFAQEDL